MTDSEKLEEIANYLRTMDARLDRLERKSDVWPDVFTDVVTISGTSSEVITSRTIEELANKASYIDEHLVRLEAKTDAYWTRLLEDFERLNSPKATNDE